MLQPVLLMLLLELAIGSFMTLTLGPMVKGFAKALDVPLPEVDRVARVLRDAKLLKTGARGVNAPTQEYIDAARLAIPFMVTDKPSRAAEAVTDFGSLVCHTVVPGKHHKKFRLGGPKQPFNIGHPLEEGIAELIRIYAEDDGEKYFKDAQPDLSPLPHSKLGYLPVSMIVVKSNHLTATIHMSGATYQYSDKFIIASNTHYREKFAKASAEGVEALRAFMDADPGAKHIELTEKYRRKIWSTREIHQGVIDEIAGLFVESSRA